MYIFLAIFLTIYGAMHGYLFWRLGTAFGPFPLWGRWLLALWLATMMTAPIIIHYLEKGRLLRLADVAGAVGYCWMAVIFWLVCGLLVIDGYNLLIHLAGIPWPAAKAALLPYRPAMLGLGLLVLVALCVGLYQARSIRVTELNIDLSGAKNGADLEIGDPGHAVPPGKHRSIRVAQISDVHLGTLARQGRLGQIVDLLKEINPDVLVSTGDLADSSYEDLRPLLDLLNEAPSPLGRFAVLGNHEYYTGLDDSLRFHQEAGFTVLRGQSVTIADGVMIAGVDDPAGLSMHRSDFLDENAALAGSEQARVVIFLKHQPRVRKSSAGKFNIQLSGHTHGGQLFPFHLFTRMAYPLYRGYTELPQGSAIYASSGTGTWGPPIRLFAQPEIVVLTLR